MSLFTHLSLITQIAPTQLICVPKIASDMTFGT